MKWTLMGLVLALVLIAVGVGLFGGKDHHPPISDNPKAAELCEEGTVAMYGFKLRDAIRLLGESLELDPSLAEASISRAFAFARLGDSDNFDKELARADSLTALIRDDRRRMRAQLRLSGLGKSKCRSLRDSVLTALEKEIPNDLDVLEAKAYDAGVYGSPEDVIAAWQRILKMNPNHAVAYNLLGYTEMYRGNYDKATEYLQKYAFLAPDLANTHDSLGELYLVTGRYEDASQEFRKSIDMQPDFYHSIINLGKVYLARGQIKKGLTIMEQVRKEVAGTHLEEQVDQEMIGTYMVSGLEENLARAVTDFVSRYPKADVSAFYRAIVLAYQGKFQEGRAVMDSTLAAWRSGEGYKLIPEAKIRIDRAEAEFEAIAADVGGDHQAAERYWGQARELQSPKTPRHELWYTNYRYAAALFANGKPREALAVLDPILQVNDRLITLLVLKVRAHLALQEGDQARKTLDQLKWAIQYSDPDFPVRATADELEAKVSAMAMK